jgi:hypothetical protein
MTEEKLDETIRQYNAKTIKAAGKIYRMIVMTTQKDRQGND